MRSPQRTATDQPKKKTRRGRRAGKRYTNQPKPPTEENSTRKRNPTREQKAARDKADAQQPQQYLRAKRPSELLASVRQEGLHQPPVPAPIRWHLPGDDPHGKNETDKATTTVSIDFASVQLLQQQVQPDMAFIFPHSSTIMCPDASLEAHTNIPMTTRPGTPQPERRASRIPRRIAPTQPTLWDGVIKI